MIDDDDGDGDECTLLCFVALESPFAAAAAPEAAQLSYSAEPNMCSAARVALGNLYIPARALCSTHCQASCAAAD